MFIPRIRSLLPQTQILSFHPLRTIHGSAGVFTGTNKTTHTTDSYSKDVDETPPADTSVYRIDPSSDRVQKPHEPPSGEWSRVGVKASQYQSADATYKAEGGAGRRYSGKEEHAKDKGPETSGKSEGPGAKSNRETGRA